MSIPVYGNIELFGSLQLTGPIFTGAGTEGNQSLEIKTAAYTLKLADKIGSVNFPGIELTDKSGASLLTIGTNQEYNYISSGVGGINSNELPRNELRIIPNEIIGPGFGLSIVDYRHADKAYNVLNTDNKQKYALIGAEFKHNNNTWISLRAGSYITYQDSSGTLKDTSDYTYGAITGTGYTGSDKSRSGGLYIVPTVYDGGYYMSGLYIHSECPSKDGKTADHDKLKTYIDILNGPSWGQDTLKRAGRIQTSRAESAYEDALCITGTKGLYLLPVEDSDWNNGIQLRSNYFNWNKTLIMEKYGDDRWHIQFDGKDLLAPNLIVQTHSISTNGSTIPISNSIRINDVIMCLITFKQTVQQATINFPGIGTIRSVEFNASSSAIVEYTANVGEVTLNGNWGTTWIVMYTRTT